MSTATSISPIVEAEAIEFLSRHDGQSALENACHLVRKCFPELGSIHVRLLEDPDEENHTWVLIQVLMPPSHSPELLQEQQARYYEELARRNPLPYHPFSFSLMLDTIRD
jgi:hypothetical protein